MNNKNNTAEESKRPATLAVTGGVGSGKSVVCQRLKSHGIPVYSADELSREAVEPGTGAYDKSGSIVCGTGGKDQKKRPKMIDISQFG